MENSNGVCAGLKDCIEQRGKKIFAVHNYHILFAKPTDVQEEKGI